MGALLSSDKDKGDAATFNAEGDPTNEAAEKVVESVTKQVRKEDIEQADKTVLKDIAVVDNVKQEIEEKEAQLEKDKETAANLAAVAAKTEGAGGVAARAKKAVGSLRTSLGSLREKARRDKSSSISGGGGGRNKRKIKSKTKKRRIQSKTKKR